MSIMWTWDPFFFFEENVNPGTDQRYRYFQWRANSGQGQLSYEFGKGNWGWSWVERWIAARPWETRLSVQPTSPKKAQSKAVIIKADNKTNSNPSRVSTPVKIAASNGKASAKRILPKPIDEKAVPQETSPKPAANKTKVKKEEHHPPQQAGVISVWAQESILSMQNKRLRAS